MGSEIPKTRIKSNRLKENPVGFDQCFRACSHKVGRLDFRGGFEAGSRRKDPENPAVYGITILASFFDVKTAKIHKIADTIPCVNRL